MAHKSLRRALAIIQLWLGILAPLLVPGCARGFTPDTKALVGEYDLGARSGLELRSDGTYEYHLACAIGVQCFDTRSGRLCTNGGRFELHNGLVTLIPHFGGELRHMLPIRWGERLYLVDVDAVPTFCAHIDHGHDPKTLSGFSGAYSLHSGHENLPAGGFAIAPLGWEDAC